MLSVADDQPRPLTILAVAQTLGISDTELIAAAVSAADFPLETSALQQLLDLVEAFTDIDDPNARQSCVDFVRGKLSV